VTFCFALDIIICIVQDIKQQIAKVLESVAGVKNPQVEFASNEAFGDYSSNVALQMANEKGNFLENIEWISKNINKKSWKDNKFSLPVGRLNSEIVKIINAKSDMVYLNGFVYAKICGWLGHRVGHNEVLPNVLWQIPYITFYPIDVYEDKNNDKRNLFAFNNGNFGVIVIEILEGKDGNEIVTMFFVNPKRLKNGLLGKYRIPSLQSPLRAAGASFSGLQESQLFYNKLEAKSQDFSLNYEIKRNPVELAKEIAEKFNNFNEKLLVKANAVEGFVNFKLKDEVLSDNLITIDENYGKSNKNKGKLAIVEYSSPNIAKPFGVGHLRSTVIGDSIANLMEAVGYKVMRDNHLGDWGTQFGALLSQITEIPNYKLQMPNWSVEDLLILYVEFHKKAQENLNMKQKARDWFKKLEDGDDEAKWVWEKCVEISFREFDKIYKLLNIKFDRDFNSGRGLGESFFESKMAIVIKELEERKLLKVGEDGAKLVFFDKDTNLSPLMILKKDGTTLYSTRDLATDKYRKEKYNPDLIINEVGSEQSLYFKQIFEIEKMLGWYKDGQRVHVGHGLFLMDGKKMSTRAGKTVKLEEVLNEAIERARKLGNEDKSDKSTARQVGIGAIKYFDLSHHPSTNINFDWDKMFAMDGNSSVYIQYTIARINSVVNKANLKGLSLQDISFQGLALKEEEIAILRKLFIFSEVVKNAAENFSPNLICNYLYDLASKFNTFYAKHRIVGLEDTSDGSFRLMLTQKTGIVLKSGLKLLGIEAPERM